MTIEAAHKTFAVIRNRVHPECVVCSCANTNGLHLKFDIVGDGSVRADFKFKKNYEGYPGMLHGGVISSILDGAMGQCIFAVGQTAVTIEMTTRFRYPVLIDLKAAVLARIVRSCPPLYLLEAEIVQDSKVKATAKGKFYDQPGLMKIGL